MRQITLEQKIRATGVTRWHIVRTAVKQSLSDHLYSVAMIAESMLAVWSAGRGPDAAQFYHRHRSRIIDKALHHDVLEALTGDCPSPYKKWFKSLTGCDLLDPSHLTCFDTCASKASLFDDNNTLDVIVKLADQIEAYHFIDRYAIDDHGRLVASRLKEVLEKVNEWMPNNGTDWAGLVTTTLESLQATPEEISDDDMARESLSS